MSLFRVIERGGVNWHDGVRHIFGIYSTEFILGLFGSWIDFDNGSPGGNFVI